MNFDGDFMKKSILFLLSTLAIFLVIVALGLFGIKFLKKEYHRRLNANIRERYDGSSSVYVLTYHHILKSKDKEKYANKNMYVVTLEDFERQLKFLKDNGYNSITTDDLYNWLNFDIELPEKSVLITFDDGYTSTYKYALPLLEKYKYNSVVFCIGKLTKDKTKAFDPSVLQYMGYDLINDIKKNHPILKIGAHSNKLHDDSFYKYSYEQIYDDVLTVKNNLNTDLYSYPGGHYNNNYLKAVKNAGYKLVFKYKPSSKTYITDSKYAVSRIEVDGNLGMNGFVDIFK